MTSNTVRARSLPYREPRPGTYKCQRCGIERNIDYRTTANNSYCRDCKTEAVALGWITTRKTKGEAA